MAPIVHGLEARYGDRINFVYLDIDDPQTQPFKTALKYIVQPDYYLLDAQGNVVDHWLGYVAEDKFVQAFDKILQQ
jgi:hypothetical protein